VFGRVRNIVAILVGRFFSFSFDRRLHFGTEVDVDLMLTLKHANLEEANAFADPTQN